MGMLHPGYIEKNLRRSRRRSRGKNSTMTRSEFSLSPSFDIDIGELELGASDDEKNSLAYSVYSEKARKNKKGVPIAEDPIKLPRKVQTKNNKINHDSERMMVEKFEVFGKFELI